MKAYVIKPGAKAKVIRKSDGAVRQGYQIDGKMLFIREDVLIDPVILRNKNYTPEAARFIKEAEAGNIVFQWPGIFDTDAKEKANGETFWVIVPDRHVLVG